MNGISKKIEIAANIAIILVAIMIGALLVQKYFLSTKPPTQTTIPIGMKLSLPNIDWAKNGRTLILALQEGCRFCSESAPFYQRLTQEVANRQIPLVTVIPHPLASGQKYLNEIGVSIGEIRQATLNSIGVRGTPTLLWVNDRGEVTGGWIGKLSPDKEAEVIRSL